MKRSFPVEGMHCQNCVRKVQQTLLQEADIESVDVDLEKGQVLIEGRFVARVDALQKMQSMLESIGYSLPESMTEKEPTGKGKSEDSSADVHGDLTSYQLSIEGMSCASCVRAVENSLGQVEGVASAVVNFADESAFVKTTGSVEPLIRAVSQAGYKAHIRGEEETRKPASFLNAILPLALGAILMLGMNLSLFPPLDAIVFWLPTGLFVLAVVVISGGHFYRGAWNALRHGTTTMDTLIALGTGCAIIYSLGVILFSEMFPEASRHVFLEAAVFVIGFVNLGKTLESRVKNRTSDTVRKLISVQPKTAVRLEDDQQIEVDLEDVSVGDLLLIRPGETLPVDGIIARGESSVDESLLTGESIPVDKASGDNVSAGTQNLYGTLTIEATQVGSETVLARLVDLVKEAQNSKPEIGRLADRISAVFVPTVIAIAVGSALLWYVFGPEPALSHSTAVLLSVLVIACPCALGLAIPMSVMVGVGRAASLGLLVKNSDALQASSSLTTVVMDKTGTLTNGTPKVMTVVSENKERTLQVALSLEQRSEHPLGKAVTDYCRENSIRSLEIEDFSIDAGGGVRGAIDGRTCFVGSHKFLTGQGIVIPDDYEVSEAATSILVAEDGELLGWIELIDELKEESVDVVQSLNNLGIKVVMLTGDGEAAAKYIGQKLALAEYQYGCSPEDKLDYIKKAQAGGEKVAMIGDGINDALALKIADVGIAMGKGSDIAIESADVALLGDRLIGVVRCLSFSRKVIKNIYQNLFGAFAYNLILIPVAAGLLYPWFGVLIDPSFAGMAMAASSVTVVVNAWRLSITSV